MAAALPFLFLPAPLRAQCPPGAEPIPIELVTNGDFSAGDAFFSSGYTSCPGPCDTEGTYSVLSDPTAANAQFVGADHTDGTGPFLVVNGDPVTGTPVWCETVAVHPGYTYLFSAWVSSVFPDFPAQLLFSVNGADLTTPINAPPVPGEWIPVNATWDSGISTSATICIVNNNTSISGNDFGLDDISFEACCPAIPDPSQAVKACNRWPIALEGPQGDDYTYLWSTGDTTRTLDVVPEEDGRWMLAILSTCTSRNAVFDIVLLDTARADVFVPNAFTPNSDGINDVFGATSYVPIAGELDIYDRWGRLLQELDVNKSWDGTAKGGPCPVGTYIYRIRTINVCAQEIERMGHVVLLR